MGTGTGTVAGRGRSLGGKRVKSTRSNLTAALHHRGCLSSPGITRPQPLDGRRHTATAHSRGVLGRHGQNDGIEARGAAASTSSSSSSSPSLPTAARVLNRCEVGEDDTQRLERRDKQRHRDERRQGVKRRAAGTFVCVLLEAAASQRTAAAALPPAAAARCPLPSAPPRPRASDGCCERRRRRTPKRTASAAARKCFTTAEVPCGATKSRRAATFAPSPDCDCFECP